MGYHLPTVTDSTLSELEKLLDDGFSDVGTISSPTHQSRDLVVVNHHGDVFWPVPANE